MSKVGWIGIGKMGSRMSRRLLDAGHELYVCDKIKTSAAALVTSGATFIEKPADLVKKVDFIFSMIPNATILREIVIGEQGILESANEGTVFIDMSTIDPDTSAEVNGYLETKKAKFLRATVTGSIAFAENGTLGIMASGDRAVYDRVLPLLRVLGNRQRYLGEGEQARTMKICINMMIGTTMQMLAESLVLGEKAGIDWNLLIECLADSAAASSILKAKEKPLKERDWSAMATSIMMEKDMDIAMDLARKYQLSLPLTAISTGFYSAMRANDLGELDYSGVLLVNEKLNNIRPGGKNGD